MMTLQVFALLFVFFSSFQSSECAVDDICNYVEPCTNDPCACNEDLNCMMCSGGQGCSDCKANYFLAGNDEKCLSCDLLDGCLDCNKEYGCSSMGCDATRNCVRKKSNMCNIWVCDGCDPLPTDSPTDQPTNDPTNDPSNNPTDGPSLIPSSEPSNQPSESPTTLEEYSEKIIQGGWDGTLTAEDLMSISDENIIIMIDGYGQASFETYAKPLGLCDISADVAMHFFDFAEVSNTVNMEYYVHCHSSDYGVFFMHIMLHLWYNQHGKLQYMGIHFLDPTPVQIMLDVLNS